MSTSEPYTAHVNSSKTLCNDEVSFETITTPHFGGVDLRRTKMSDVVPLTDHRLATQTSQIAHCTIWSGRTYGYYQCAF